MVFAADANSAMGFRSTPNAEQPAVIASTSVVPEPHIGSSTVSPGLARHETTALGIAGMNFAGYG
jgi:hypothetical protein